MSTPENPYANPVSTAPALSPAEEKQWSILTHVLSIFFGAISAAVFYFLYRDRGPFVKAHTATEWNFQLTLLIVSGVAFFISFVGILGSFGTSSSTSGPPPTLALFFVGYVMMFAVRIVGLIFGIVASAAAAKGRYYRYSLAIPFVK